MLACSSTSRSTTRSWPSCTRLAAHDARIVIVASGDDRFGAADVVGSLGPSDRLEPNALFELALALQETPTSSTRMRIGSTTTTSLVIPGSSRIGRRRRC